MATKMSEAEANRALAVQAKSDKYKKKQRSRVNKERAAADKLREERRARVKAKKMAARGAKALKVARLVGKTSAVGIALEGATQYAKYAKKKGDKKISDARKKVQGTGAPINYKKKRS